MAASTNHSIGPLDLPPAIHVGPLGYAAVGLASVQVVSQCVRRRDQVQFNLVFSDDLHWRGCIVVQMDSRLWLKCSALGDI